MRVVRATPDGVAAGEEHVVGQPQPEPEASVVESSQPSPLMAGHLPLPFMTGGDRAGTDERDAARTAVPATASRGGGVAARGRASGFGGLRGGQRDADQRGEAGVSVSVSMAGREPTPS